MSLPKNTDYIAISANLGSIDKFEENTLRTKSQFNEALTCSSSATIFDHGISVSWSRLTNRAKNFLSKIPPPPFCFPESKSTLFIGNNEDYFEETCLALWASKINKKPLCIDVIIDLNNDPFVLSLVTGILNEKQKERPLHVLSLKCDNKKDFSNVISPDETSLSLITKSLFNNEEEQQEALSYLLGRLESVPKDTLEIINESRSNGVLSLVENTQEKGYSLVELFSPGSTVIFQLPLAVYDNIDSANARLLDVLNICRIIKLIECNHDVDFNVTISGLSGGETISDAHLIWLADNTNVILNTLYYEEQSQWMDFAVNEFESSYLSRVDSKMKIPLSMHCISDTIMELGCDPIGSQVVLVQKGNFVNIPLKISPPLLPLPLIPKEIKHKHSY